MDGMHTQWQRLTSLLYTLEPQALDDVQAGATEGQIAACEKATQMQWPADFKALLHISNGGLRLPGNQQLSGLAQILEGWAGWAAGYELDPGDELPFDPDDGYPPPRARSVAGHDQLLPLTDETNWGLYVDMSPGPAGRVGQIVYTSHGGFLEWVSWSVLDHLRLTADAVEQGRIYFDAARGWVDVKTGQDWYGSSAFDVEGTAP
jgi:cell wall assembly regulator SMI1